VQAFGVQETLLWRRAAVVVDTLAITGAIIACKKCPICGSGLSGDKRKKHRAFLQSKPLMPGGWCKSGLV
jgi:hypothetical protein